MKSRELLQPLRGSPLPEGALTTPFVSAKGQRQTRRAFPEMGNNGRFATLQGVLHRWCLSEAEADEGAGFALSLERGKKLVLRIVIVP